MVLARNVEQDDESMCRVPEDNFAFLIFGVISLCYI